MDVLVTGASSFIGSHLATALCSAGHRTYATFRTHNLQVGALVGVSMCETLPLDLECLEQFETLPDSIDAVVHVAGISTDDDISAMLACNVEGTRNVLCYALRAGATRLIYTSSLSVHGSISGGVVDENTPIVDPNVYGATKYLGERMIADAADRLPAVALRLPGIVGLGAHRAWLPTLADQILAGEDVTIYNPDAAFNNVVHVHDLGRFVVDLLRSEWAGYSAMPLGTKDYLSVCGLVELLRAGLGGRVCVTANSQLLSGFTISVEKACREFGYAPMPIAKVIKRYAQEIVRSRPQ